MKTIEQIGIIVKAQGYSFVHTEQKALQWMARKVFFNNVPCDSCCTVCQHSCIRGLIQRKGVCPLITAWSKQKNVKNNMCELRIQRFQNTST